MCESNEAASEAALAGEILTPRLRLVPLNIIHAEALYRIRAKPAVHVRFRKGPWLSLHAAETFVNKCLLNNFNDSLASSWVITRRAHSTSTAVSSSDVIGFAGLNPSGDLMYMIDPEYNGQGFCTEAVREVLPRILHCQPDFDQVVAWVMSDNAASIRVLEKCGFRREDQYHPHMRWKPFDMTKMSEDGVLEEDDYDKIERGKDRGDNDSADKSEGLAISDLRQALCNVLGSMNGSPRPTAAGSMVRFALERDDIPDRTADTTQGSPP